MEELRQQVRLLQAVGYNHLDDDMTPGTSGEGTGAGSGGDGSGGGRGGLGHIGSLEAMLLQKNRHLEHELTMARLKVVDFKAELDAAMAQVAELEAQVGVVGGWVGGPMALAGLCWGICVFHLEAWRWVVLSWVLISRHGGDSHEETQGVVSWEHCRPGWRVICTLLMPTLPSCTSSGFPQWPAHNQLSHCQ